MWLPPFKTTVYYSPSSTRPEIQILCHTMSSSTAFSYLTKCIPPFSQKNNNGNVPYFHGYLPARKVAGQDPGTAVRRLAVGRRYCISEKLLWSYEELLQNEQILVVLRMNSPWSKNAKKMVDKHKGRCIHRSFTNVRWSLFNIHRDRRWQRHQVSNNIVL